MKLPNFKKASDEELDAFYSVNCLKYHTYPYPKYCLSYGREYIIREIKKAVKRDNNKRY